MKRSAIPDLILQQGADAIGVWEERYSRRELDGVDMDGLRHQFLRMLASSRRRLRRPAVPNPPQDLDAPCRDMHGFDKRMANFCVRQDGGGHVRLLSDERAASDDRQPRFLSDISLINLVEETGSGNGPTIVELNCSPPIMRTGTCSRGSTWAWLS